MGDAQAGNRPAGVRVGATSFARTDATVLARIERNEEDARTHIEQMAIDMGRLLAATEPILAPHAESFLELPFLARMRNGGVLLLGAYGREAYSLRRPYYRDIARGWQAFAISADGLTLQESLDAIEPFVVDPHFAVREFAWLAVRPRIVSDPSGAVSHFLNNTDFASPHAARFAIESTRPRSVWGAHSPHLKERPEVAEQLLLLASANQDPYVNKAIANWIRDAAETRADWARQFADLLSNKAISPLLSRRLSALSVKIRLAGADQPA